MHNVQGTHNNFRIKPMLPGLQKLDGIQGNLVIRTPKSKDLNGNQYDVDVPEHVLMILDWMNTTAEERFPGLRQRQPGQMPITFLLEGRGRPKVLYGNDIRLLGPNSLLSYTEFNKILGHVTSNGRETSD
jgi:hypothetical protein